MGLLDTFVALDTHPQKEAIRSLHEAGGHERARKLYPKSRR
jgi:hypothetical protein